MALLVTPRWTATDEEHADSAQAAGCGAISISLDKPPMCLTKAEDVLAKGISYEVEGAVLPLASWFARKWLIIFRSPRISPPQSASRAESYEWVRSHCLRYVGDGTALPNVTFQPAGRDAIHVSWAPDPDNTELPLRFLSNRGHRTIPLADVEAAIARLVETVLLRLRDHASDSPTTKALQAAWVLARTHSPEHVAARFAAIAGLDWSLLSHERREAWRQLASRPHLPLFRDALAALPPDRSDEAEHLAREAVEAAEGAPHSDDVRNLRTILGDAPKGLPWDVGRECAHRLRRATNHPHDRPFHADPMPTTRTRSEIDSVVAVAPGRSPVRLVNATFTDTRFKTVRDLWSVLFASNGDGDVRGSVFSGRSDRDGSVARAFSAELIAPIAAIKNRLPRPFAEEEDVEWLAEELRAPELCVLHQLENSGLLSRRGSGGT